MARIEEGDIKDKEKEVDLLGEIAVSANNQGKSIPRKRDYRQEDPAAGGLLPTLRDDQAAAE